jgi:CRP/FNR family transcriptional regulator, nitrogen oxide reductase regulator
LTGSLISQKAPLVQRFPLFSGLSLSDCTNVLAVAREKNFSRRQTIFSEGDPVQQILVLLSGCVKLMQFGQDGGEVILRLAGMGEVVGAIGLCSEVGHCATAQTTELSTALVWDRATFEALLERFPMLRRNMIRVLEMRLQEMDQRFREISTQKVAPRLSSQLVRLLSQVGKKVNGHVEISLSRAELAQLTGTTLFTVSRLLSQWKMQGIVNVRRESVLVRDLPALVELSHGELEHEVIPFRTSASA